MFLDVPNGSRRDASAELDQLFPGRFTRGRLMEVLEGDQPLCVVPRASASDITERLGRRGVPTRTVNKRDLSGTLSPRFRRVLALVLVCGAMAGFMADALILWLSPLVALSLALAAYRVNTRARFGSYAHRPRETVQQSAVIDTLLELPPGAPKELLSRIVEVHAAFHGGRTTDTPVGRAVSDLLEAACTTAQYLESVENQLAHLRGMSTGHTGDRMMFDHHDELCETRDRLVAVLQQAGRVATQAARVRSNEGGDAEIVEATEALRLQIDAHREVEALLQR